MQPWFHALKVCQHWWPMGNSSLHLLSLAIAQGEISAFDDVALAALLNCYPLNAKKLILESTMRIGGSLDDILQSTSDLEWQPPTDSGEREVWAERHFLAGFASNRFGKPAQAAQHWECASAELPALDVVRSLQARVALEYGVGRLNLGFDAEAYATTKALIEQDQLDSISRIRALAVHGLAAATLGRFTNMNEAWNEEKGIVDAMQNISLVVTWKRRQAEGFVIRERFHEALKLINEGIEESSEMPSLRALFLNLKIETLLLRNELSAAERGIEELQTLLEKRVMPANVVSIAGHRCELSLRRRNYEQAREYSRQILADEEESKKLPAQVRAFIVQARLDLIAEQFVDARRAIEKAIELAKNQGYAPMLVDALFHAAGIAFSTRDNLGLRRFLEQARNLARELKLELKENCFEYVIARLREPLLQPSLRPLLVLLTQGVRAVEIVYLLNYYGFGLDIQRVLAQKDLPPLVINEQELWEKWLQQDGLFWLPDDGLLFARAAGVLRTADVRSSPGLVACVSLFLQNDLKITLEQAHHLTSQAAFHAARHEAKSRSLINRLRKLFSEVGIDVARNAQTHAYCSNQVGSVFWISNIKN